VGGQVLKRDNVIDFINWRQLARASDNKTLDKRWFLDDWTEARYRHQGWPTTGDAFDLLANGALRPEFFNFFRYRGNQIELEGEHLPQIPYFTLNSSMTNPLPAVFLLGPNPGSITGHLQRSPDQRFLVLHMHFNANGPTSAGNLAIDQINIRHAARIQAEENPPVPGRYRAGGSDIDGEQCFMCRDRRTGLDPWTTVAPTSLQEELVLEVVQTIRRWGGEWESV
jgi:hypothetical protein